MGRPHPHPRTFERLEQLMKKPVVERECSGRYLAIGHFLGHVQQELTVILV